MRVGVLLAAGAIAVVPPACSEAEGDAGPMGKYVVEVSLGEAVVDGELALVGDGRVEFGRLTFSGEPPLVLDVSELDERTATLDGRVAAIGIELRLRFDTDRTLSGTLALGPNSGSITGRRGIAAGVDPEPPQCEDGSGELPRPVPVSRPGSEPDVAEIHSSDVTLFWETLDAGSDETLASRLHCEYLRSGSDALRDFIPSRIVSAETLAEAVLEHRERYEAVRESSLSLAELEPEIREVFQNLYAMLPDAVFPDVHFVAGRFTTGGTISQRGLILGAEMYLDRSRVIPVVAHELVHFQQRIPGHESSLLAQSITEGSADFIGELISGGTTIQEQYEYGIAHEDMLWEEFSRVMHGTDFDGWLYGGQPEGRPGDLGYFFGYRIAEAYFHRAGANEDALRGLLVVDDFAGLLEESGYDPGR
jgi:hypothetical protein